jgi:prephenate dehydrogenase
VEIVTAFWSSLGSVISVMTPAEHDRMAARLSHLPHVLAYSLVNLAATTLPEGVSILSGGSYRDATRVALSNPGLWTGILMENRAEVAAAVHDMASGLSSIATMLEKGDAQSLLDLLTQAKNHRDSMPAYLSRPST